MTVRAVTGEFAVVTLDGESGLFGVIEVRRVDGSQVSVASLMFNVADGAVGYRDLAMDSLSSLHSPGNLIVADETSAPVDIEVVIVAIVAAVWILQPLVSDTEPAGHEIDLIFLCERRHSARDQNHRHYEEKSTDPDTPHPALTGTRISSTKWDHRHWTISVCGIPGRPVVRGGAKISGVRARGIVSSQGSLTPDLNLVLLILTHEHLI